MDFIVAVVVSIGISYWTTSKQGTKIGDYFMNLAICASITGVYGMIMGQVGFNIITAFFYGVGYSFIWSTIAFYFFKFRTKKSRL